MCLSSIHCDTVTNSSDSWRLHSNKLQKSNSFLRKGHWHRQLRAFITFGGHALRTDYIKANVYYRFSVGPNILSLNYGHKTSLRTVQDFFFLLLS